VTRPAVVALVVAATLVALVPVFVPALHAPGPVRGPLGAVLVLLALATPLAAVLACWRWAPLDLDARAKAGLFGLLVGLTLLQTHLHLTMVDQAPHIYSSVPFDDNTHWQRVMHRQGALERAPHPYFTPHNVRFLPNGYTQWLHVATGSFVVARTLYRLTFGFLLLLAVYALARAWFSHRVGLLAVLFHAAIYPVSIRYYAGQLTDPMSHLSIVLGSLALVRRDFAGFALCVAVGSLAKESVLALVPAYAWVHRQDKGQVARALALLAGTLALGWGIRHVVLAGRGVNADTIASVTWEHVRVNLGEWPVWVPQTLLVLSPGAALVAAWGRTPPVLRGLAVWLVVVLFATSARFSWLREARNLVPAAVLLGIVAGAWLLGELDEDRA
jgi:hypothetical protein